MGNRASRISSWSLMPPDPNVGPLWEIPKKTPYIKWVFGGEKNHQESIENTINTMGTLLGVHPIIPWYLSKPIFLPVRPHISWHPAQRREEKGKQHSQALKAMDIQIVIGSVITSRVWQGSRQEVSRVCSWEWSLFLNMTRIISPKKKIKRIPDRRVWESHRVIFI